MHLSAAAAAIHPTLLWLPLVPRLLLAAKPTDLFATGQPDKVMILVAHFAAAHARATIPVMRDILLLAAYGAFSQALPFHQEKPVFPVTLGGAACTSACIPAVTDHFAP